MSPVINRLNEQFIISVPHRIYIKIREISLYEVESSILTVENESDWLKDAKNSL